MQINGKLRSKRVVCLLLCILLSISAGLMFISSAVGAYVAPREYYISNGGNDNADGETPGTAWATITQLNSTVFNPGDMIYLDATSSWNGQLTLHGSGEENNPITLTKYNDNNDSTQRPVINGNGTVSLERRWGLGIGADNITSGTVELINVSFWEIIGLEITNLGASLAQRRCGVRVLSDYAAGPSDRTMENYVENKMDHIYIRDCYVHDVNSAHQGQVASGYDGAFIAGAKGGGGIISSGFVDDLLVEGCTVTRCDSEGIRNEACGPDSGSYGGIDANNGFPQAAKVTFRNNYVSKCSGDGIVMSGASGGVMENNYITQCGKSYLTDLAGNLLPDHGDNATPQRLGTQNYSAMWFIGCANSVAQYNASVNNSYESAIGGTAWGIDAYCDNVIYQYNYSTGNPGGWYAHKYASANTAIRYNISVDDGMSPGFNKTWDSFILLDPLGSNDETDAPKIYNNLIVLNLKEDTTFFGRNDNNAHVYFQNNIVYSKNRSTVDLIGGQDKTVRSISNGDFTNNLLFPNGLFDLAPASFLAPEVNTTDNLFDDPLLEDIEAVPLDVLRNLDGSAIDSIGARNMIFDTAKLADFRLTPNSPAIEAGEPVVVAAETDQWWPLATDIYGDPINGPLNIGVQQSMNILVQSVTITGVPTNNEILAKTFQLGVEVLPENATDMSVTWYVTDEYGDPTSLADISQSGLLTIYESGTVIIKVVANDGSACEDSVLVDLIYAYLELGPGQAPSFVIRKNMITQLKLDTNLSPLTFTSGNSSVVTVTQTGVVTGKSIGVAVIQVKHMDTGLMLNIVVNCTN